MQQETAQQIAEARGQAEAKHAAHVEELKALSAEELETSVSNARAELNRAVAERDQQHEEALGLVQADAENLRAELMRLQGEFSARVEQAGQEAYRAYGTQLTEMEARVSATREAHAAAEASFARKQAEMAEQHKEALARVRSDAERAEATIESLQNAVSDQVEQARREEVTAQATKLAEVEARAEAALRRCSRNWLPVSSRRDASLTPSIGPISSNCAPRQKSPALKNRRGVHNATVRSSHRFGPRWSRPSRLGAIQKPHIPNYWPSSSRGQRSGWPQPSVTRNLRPNRSWPRPKQTGRSDTRPSCGGSPPGPSKHWSVSSRWPSENQIVYVTRP